MNKGLIHYREVCRRTPSVHQMITEICSSPYQGEDLLAHIGHLVPFSGTATMLIYCMVCYMRTGSQSFVVGPHVREMLLNTSLEGVNPAEIRLPYEAFYVSLPESNSFIWGGERTGWHQMGGFYVSLNETSAGPGMTIFCWGAPNERSFDYGDDGTFWFNLRLDEVNGPLESHLDKMIQQDDGQTNELSGSDRPEVRDSYKQVAISCARILCNLSQYLSSEGREVEVHGGRRERRQQKRLAKKRRLPNQPTGFPVGVVTLVAPSIEDHYAKNSQGDSKASRQHWVRGHWKTVRYGSLSLPERPVRRIWIQPYLRGDEATGVIGARDYNVR